MSKYFKTNLKYLRNKNGIEQLELANMLGLKSASAVSEWENCQVFLQNILNYFYLL